GRNLKGEHVEGQTGRAARARAEAAHVQAGQRRFLLWLVGGLPGPAGSLGRSTSEPGPGAGQWSLVTGDITVIAQGTKSARAASRLGVGSMPKATSPQVTAAASAICSSKAMALSLGEGGAEGALATASLGAHGAGLGLGAVDVQARASDQARAMPSSRR